MKNSVSFNLKVYRISVAGFGNAVTDQTAIYKQQAERN